MFALEGEQTKEQSPSTCTEMIKELESEQQQSYIEIGFFPMRLIKQWNGLPKETVAFLSFESFWNATGQSTDQLFVNSNTDGALSWPLDYVTPEVPRI